MRVFLHNILKRKDVGRMESYIKAVEEVLQDVQSSKQGLSKQEASLRLKKKDLINYKVLKK